MLERVAVFERHIRGANSALVIMLFPISGAPPSSSVT
jgi:hypothetical protein